MLYREIIAVCSEIHTKHLRTLRGQNVELLNVKPGGTYSKDWAVKGQLNRHRISFTYFQCLCVNFCFPVDYARHVSFLSLLS